MSTEQSENLCRLCRRAPTNRAHAIDPVSATLAEAKVSAWLQEDRFLLAQADDAERLFGHLLGHVDLV